MAGRPATVRGGGVSGAQIGLIVFAFISVAALGLFIFQLTQVKELQQRAETAEQRLQHIGQPSAPLGTYYDNEATARGTASVFAVMTDDLGKVSQLVAGEPGLIAKVLVQQSNELLGQVAKNQSQFDPNQPISANDTLLTAIRKLDERAAELARVNEKQASELAEAQQKNESLTQQLKVAREQFEEQIADTKADYEHAVADFSSKLSAKDDQVRGLQGTLESREKDLQDMKRTAESDKREWDLEKTRRDKQIAGFQKKIEELAGTFDPEAILKKADGRVLRAIPGSSIVYISLGANDNVRVGMSFEVFSQTSTPTRTMRGKASLDVINVMDDTAECRVTRADPNQPITEGDTIVNIAYEEGRKPKFVVRGNFDLNYDGQVDFNGAEEIKSMIRRWGGQVVPELDESVDYVVIGTAPNIPDLPPSASDIQRDQAERRLLEKTPFDALKKQAIDLHIPVITQNQFLFLTGYVSQPDRSLYKSTGPGMY
jgi:hypothetical protein